MLDQLSKTKDSSDQVVILKEIGLYYQNQQIYNKAIEYYLRSLDQDEKATDDNSLPLLENIAFCYAQKNKYKEAGQFYTKILNVYHSRNDIPAQVNILNELQFNSKREKKYLKALEYNREIVRLSKPAGLSDQLINAYNNIGFLYKELGNNVQSLNSYQEALKIALNQKSEDKEGIARIHINTGVAYTHLRKFKEANTHFLAAQRIYLELKQAAAVAKTYNYLAANQLISGKFRSSINYAEKAASNAQAMGADEVLMNSYLILSEAYEQEENLLKSQEYLRLYQKLKEKISEEARQKQEEKMKIEIDLQKKENEIKTLLYEKDKQNLALKQAELERAQKEKDLKLKEKELLIARRREDLQAAELKNQQLEKDKVLQLLLLAEQKSKNEKQKLQNEQQQRKISEQKYLAEQKEKESLKKQQELENAKMDQAMKEQQLESITNSRRFFITLFVAVGIIALLVLIGLLVNIRQARKLKVANEEIQEKNNELVAREEEIRQNMEELEAAQELMKTNQDEIQRQNYQLEKQTEVLKKTYKQIKTKNAILTDSILYAERMQQAILPGMSQIKATFEDAFVIYQPKDIVSGDFYWFGQNGPYSFVAVVDCTGHGVPGAFMSLIGNALLNEIILQKGIVETNLILDHLREGVKEALSQNESSNTDGMDISLCRFKASDDNKIQVQFSGAKSTLLYFHDHHLSAIRGDRKNIGGIQQKDVGNFNQNTVKLKPSDSLYIFTDGFTDHPSPKRRRFGEKKLKQVLEEIYFYPLDEQETRLRDALLDHSKSTPQRDDITLMGIKLGDKILTAQPLAPKNGLNGHHKSLKLDQITKATQNGEHHRDFNFFEYHAKIANADVLLSYKGPLTDYLLSEFSKDIRDKVKEHPKAGKKVFTIFMELAQNVLFYSKEVNHFRNNDRVGTLIIVDTPNHYRVMTGNMIFHGAVEFLRDKIEKVNSFNREELREYKRFLRSNNNESEESRGAGIGIVQAALTSSNPIDFEIREFGEDFAFFLLSVKVKKSP